MIMLRTVEQNQTSNTQIRLKKEKKMYLRGVNDMYMQEVGVEDTTHDNVMKVYDLEKRESENSEWENKITKEANTRDIFAIVASDKETMVTRQKKQVKPARLCLVKTVYKRKNNVKNNS